MIWIAAVPAAVAAGWLLGRGDAAANLRAAGEAAPAALLLSLQGVTAGLCARDRVRLRRAHASPSLAWLGKRLLLLSACGAATFTGAPVAWPAEALTGCAAASAAGWALWVGNLPPRL